MKPNEQKRALAAAVAAARAAGKLMQQNFAKAKVVNEATHHDIKLELDVRCQKLIEKMLHKAFPEIPFLGEEGITGDVAGEYRWVVDPIDGTVNYAFGIPHAAVSIALQYRGQSIVGVIYGPFTDELWTAIRGEQTKWNGKPVSVSNRTKIEDAIIAMGFSKSKENLEKSIPYLNRLARQAKKIRIMGSAALELAYVASGRLDIYIERRINLWDVAAGSLLVECAGGEFYTKPAPGKFRYTMCADNGKLRKKLKLEPLLTP